MMINHHLQAALARDRQATLRAEAAAARLARQARPRRAASRPGVQQPGVQRPVPGGTAAVG